VLRGADARTHRSALLAADGRVARGLGFTGARLVGLLGVLGLDLVLTGRVVGLPCQIHIGIGRIASARLVAAVVDAEDVVGLQRVGGSGRRGVQARQSGNNMGCHEVVLHGISLPQTPLHRNGALCELATMALPSGKKATLARSQVHIHE